MVESFDLSIGVLSSEHKYKLIINLTGTSNHKFLSYNVEGIDNTYIEICELLSF